MSNEYKAWIEDRVTEVLLDAGELDYINTIFPEKMNHSTVIGQYRGEDRVYDVWFDSRGEGEWKFKRTDC